MIKIIAYTKELEKVVITNSDKKISYAMKLNRDLEVESSISANALILYFDTQNDLEFSKEVFDFYTNIITKEINNIEVYYDDNKIYELSNYSNLSVNNIYYEQKLNSINVPQNDSINILERIIVNLG